LSEQKFKPGDAVTWTSQAGGKSKTKQGIVKIIVAPGVQLLKALEKDEGDFNVRDEVKKASRSHESYLIQVGKSKRLYWPLVKYLKLAEEKFLPLTLREDGRFENEGEDNSERYENPGPDALHILNPSEPKGGIENLAVEIQPAMPRRVDVIIPSESKGEPTHE